MQNGQIGSTSETFQQCMQRLGRESSGKYLAGKGGGRLLKREGNNYKKIRYSFDGAIPTNIPTAEAFNTILQSAPNALSYRTRLNKFAVDIPDELAPIKPGMTAEESDVVGTINDSMLMAKVVLNRPRARDAGNQVVVKGPNVFKDLSEDTDTFPTPGSTLERQFLALDNGEKSILELDTPAIIDPELKHSAGINFLTTSRRADGVFVTSMSAFKYIEGNVIRLNSPDSRVDMIVRIIAKNIIGRFIRFRFIEYKRLDSSYIPRSDSTIAPIEDRPDLTVNAPTNVMASHDSGTGVARVTWQLSNEQNAERFEVQHKLDDLDWAPVAFIDDIDTKVAQHVVEFGEHRHKYRVRTLGFNGGYSVWSESTEATLIGGERAPGFIYEELPSGKECPPAARGGSPGWQWMTPTGRFFLWEQALFDPSTGWLNPTEENTGVIAFGRINVVRSPPAPFNRDINHFVSRIYFIASATNLGIQMPSGSYIGHGSTPPNAASLPAYLTRIAINTASTTDSLSGATIIIVVGANRSSGEITAANLHLSSSFIGRLGLLFHKRVSDVDSHLVIDMGPVDAGAAGYTASALLSDDARAEISTFFDTTRDYDVAIVDLSKRCSGDFTNPWIERPRLTGGQQRETVYTLASANIGSGSIRNSQLPSNDLAYQGPLSNSSFEVGGKTWYYREQQATDALRWSVHMFRIVTNEPSPGDPKQPDWSNWIGPIYQYNYADDRTRLVEELFTGTNDRDTFPANPDSNLNYKASPLAPATLTTAGALYRSRPFPVSTIRFIWRNSRLIPSGTSVNGDVGSIEWSGWNIVDEYDSASDDLHNAGKTVYGIFFAEPQTPPPADAKTAAVPTKVLGTMPNGRGQAWVDSPNGVWQNGPWRASIPEYGQSRGTIYSCTSVVNGEMKEWQPPIRLQPLPRPVLGSNIDWFTRVISATTSPPTLTGEGKFGFARPQAADAVGPGPHPPITGNFKLYHMAQTGFLYVSDVPSRIDRDTSPDSIASTLQNLGVGDVLACAPLTSGGGLYRGHFALLSLRGQPTRISEDTWRINYTFNQWVGRLPSLLDIPSKLRLTMPWDVEEPPEDLDERFDGEANLRVAISGPTALQEGSAERADYSVTYPINTITSGITKQTRKWFTKFGGVAATDIASTAKTVSITDSDDMHYSTPPAVSKDLKNVLSVEVEIEYTDSEGTTQTNPLPQHWKWI